MEEGRRDNRQKGRNIDEEGEGFRQIELGEKIDR